VINTKLHAMKMQLRKSIANKHKYDYNANILQTADTCAIFQFFRRKAEA